MDIITVRLYEGSYKKMGDIEVDVILLLLLIIIIIYYLWKQDWRPRTISISKLI
jgi:hypothetical protein